MKTGERNSKARAFTLIEIVISAALMALILTSAYLCLRAAIQGQRLVEPRADILQNARVATALLTADLRSACPLSTNYQFLGMRRKIGDMDADNLDFATHNYTPVHPREGDYCEISYFVDKDEATGQFGLYRRRNPVMAIDPLSGGSREQIALGIRGVRFEYFDGYDWYDDWGSEKGNAGAAGSKSDQPNMDGIPLAVRMTISFESHSGPTNQLAEPDRPAEPPLVFQTVARLNLADAGERTVGANNTSGASSAGTGTGAQPTGGNPGNAPQSVQGF